MVTDDASLTTYLAIAMGVLFSARSLAGLIDPQHALAIQTGYLESPTAAYAAGFAAFVIGCTLIALHTRWSSPLAIAVTLVGWLAAIEGLMLICAPRLYARLTTSGGRGALLITLAFGATLLAAGLLSHFIEGIAP